jgi:DNA-binding MarR family transcriptional regulator
LRTIWVPIPIGLWYDAYPSSPFVLVIMTKTTRTTRSSRDLRTLLHVPQHDLQSQVTTRLERLGFPALRPAHVQLLSAVGTDNIGVRLADLVTAVSLPKQTVGDLIDDLETMRMVERFPDPDHGVIKRVRLGPKGRVWANEVKRVAQATEARWASQLGSKKMKSLRALLEELAATVEDKPKNGAANGAHRRRG